MADMKWVALAAIASAMGISLAIGAALLLAMLDEAPARELYPGQYDEAPAAVRQWFNGLMRPDRRPLLIGCCSEADCRPVETQLTPAGGYQVKVDDEWRDVPADRVERDPRVLQANPTGKAVACWIGTGESLFFYCLEPYDVLG